MERGILIEPDVVELLRHFERLEIFTDNKHEREYSEVQGRVTGYNANPTYIILDSANHREVARTSFTNDKDEFIAFLEQGKENVPAFRSQVVLDELVPLDEQLEDTVEWPQLDSIVSDPGAVAQYLGREAREYTGEFRATQALVLPKELPAGRYRVVARLITSIYEEDSWVRALSVRAVTELLVE